MMERQFVISQIHGQLRTLERLLDVWKPKEETLIVLGDNNDYGPNSFLVYKKLAELKTLYRDQVVFLKGTHELLFEKFIANPGIYAEDYFDNGGAATLASFYHRGLSFQQLNDTNFLIHEILPKIDFSEFFVYLEDCVPVYETETSVFLSKEPTVLKEQLTKDWQTISHKKLFFSLENDEAFKLDYFSKLAKEAVGLEDSFETHPFVIKKDIETTQLGVVSFSYEKERGIQQVFKPTILACKIGRGFILEELKFTLEE